MIAVLTIAYNEAEWIKQCVEQFKPLRHLVLVSTKPWNGAPAEYDNTAELAREAGAEVITGYWPTEAEQRNYGLALLRDYDYVLIVDADELYTQEDRQKLLSIGGCPAYRAPRMLTYWKTPDFVLDPPDTHQPVVAVDPKKVQFYEHRQIRKFTDTVPEFEQQPIDITLHHMSWAKSDAKVREKIASFSHAEDIKPNWYEEIWKKWTPGSEMNVRPYGKEISKAIKKQT